MTVRAKFEALLAGAAILILASGIGRAQQSPEPLEAQAEKPLKVTIYSLSRLTKPIYIDDGFIEIQGGLIIYWNGWYFPEGTLTTAQSPVSSDITTAVVQAVTAGVLKISHSSSPELLLAPIEGWVFGQGYAGLSWPQLLAAFGVNYARPLDVFKNRGIYGSPAQNKHEYGADAHGARLALADPAGAADFRTVLDVHRLKKD
jgi:hypothetical protein